MLVMNHHSIFKVIFTYIHQLSLVVEPSKNHSRLLLTILLALFVQVFVQTANEVAYCFLSELLIIDISTYKHSC